MPNVSLKPPAQLFRAAMFRELCDRTLLDEGFVAKLLTWRHTSGFSVHNGVRIAAGDTKGLEGLAQDVIHSPFSTAKMTCNTQAETVIYRSKMTHGKNRRNFQVFEAEEFIAAITQHIPEKSFQMVRYYGWYSNKTRGDRRLGERQADDVNLQIGEDTIAIADYEPRQKTPPDWNECIKRIWEVDLLTCPHCQGEMRIVRFITDYPVVRKILKHPDLWGRSPPVPKLPEPEELVYEPFDDGWPGYEGPFVVAQ